MNEVGVQPVVNWPHRVLPGHSYLITVDLRLTDPSAPWPYDEEEFAIGCMLDGRPACTVRALGDSGVVLHRFGGSYGPARFIAEFRGGHADFAGAALWLTLTTSGGIPFYTGRLPIDGSPLVHGENDSESAESIDTWLDVTAPGLADTAANISVNEPNAPVMRDHVTDSNGQWAQDPEAFVIRILSNLGHTRNGLGVLIGDRIIVTCAHVINYVLGRNPSFQEKPNSSFLIEFPLLSDVFPPVQAAVTGWHPPSSSGMSRDDIAYLTLDGALPPGTGPAFLSAEPGLLGQTARVFGYPMTPPRPNGVFARVSVQGRVAGGMLQLESMPGAPLRVQPGFEGGPVIDESGRLLGIIQSASAEIEMPDSNAISADRLRRMAPEPLTQEVAPSPDETDDYELPDVILLASLLGITDPSALDTSRLWAPRPNHDRLRIPFGLDPQGNPVEIDLKDASEDGMGPHGILVGATGSGKSELLRTLVLGLAMTHDPSELNFVLVDFKGGAGFLGVNKLPHVSAVITNLAEELPLVDRMRDAIAGELNRRQEVLRERGNFASLRDYHRARLEDTGLPPLPTLFMVLDEFSELLAAKPEFIDLFVQIGRIGRSLGVHLLLASQRLEEGRLRGLESQISYRIGLRTFSPQESRLVLEVPDAYELPTEPGHGYLKTGQDFIRFKGAYVSGSADPGRSAMSPSFLDLVVAQLAASGTAAHQIWLPPLAEPPTLDSMLPALTAGPRGLTTVRSEGHALLRAPICIVDKPYEQKRDPKWVDLSGGAGHVAVVGAPRTGKSTAVRTLLSSLALLHTPEEVQFYILDFGGGSLAAMDGLPHIGGTAARLQGDRVRRTIAEVRMVLEQRERAFADQGIDSIATYRRRRARGEIQGDGFGDVFLVVDGWLTLRQDFEQLEAVITSVAARGLGYGIHVIVTTNKWSEFRPAIRDLFGTRLELRLGDPYESEVGRALAANVLHNAPGRGLTKEGLHFLTAVPRIDGQETADGLPDASRALVDQIRDSWHGRTAPPVRTLPDMLSVAQLPEPAAPRVPFGIDESALAPVSVDFDADPHFLIIGDNECGKSNLLRLIVSGITRSYTEHEAMILFFDYRRSLLDASDVPHKLGYVTSSAAATSMMNDLREVLANRLPTPDLTAEQLRSRSWWKGAEVYVVVDDYDLVAGGTNPLAILAEFLPAARDIGLHLVLARSAGGAGRAMFEPVILRLREMGTPGLIMSGSSDEGPLFGGTRPTQLPPGRGYLVERRGGARLVQTAYLGNLQ